MEFVSAWIFVLHILEKLHGLKAWFKHRISVTLDTSEFGKADFFLLLEEGVIIGWWDKEAHKISYYIVSKLLEYAYEINVKHEISVRCALLALDQDIVLQAMSRETRDCARARQRAQNKYFLFCGCCKERTSINFACAIINFEKMFKYLKLDD